MVVAKTPESEPLVEAVADWLLHSEWASFSKPTERGPDVDRASASDSH
jgi:hypothetical protein